MKNKTYKQTYDGATVCTRNQDGTVVKKSYKVTARRAARARQTARLVKMFNK